MLRAMKAIWNGQVVAESDDTVVVDGNHYFPPDALVHEHFIESDHTTVCGWKGTANYYSVRVGDDTNENAAWVYRDPKDAAKELEGRVAFWKGVEIVE